MHHLDALRSVLMVLGVFLHASYPYAAHEQWLVKDGDTSPVLAGVNAAIHFFRIPCFFILSGFFSQMMIGKRGESDFLRSRLKRLVLPMVATAVLVNTWQSGLLASARQGLSLGAFFSPSAQAQYWKSGEWVGHLWFLFYLTAYSAAAAGVWSLWKLGAPRIAGLALRLPVPSRTIQDLLIGRGLCLLLLPLIPIVNLALAAVVPGLYGNWGGLSGYALLQFFPYYAFGLLLFLIPRLREEFHRIRPWQAASLPIAAAAGALLPNHSDIPWIEAADLYITAYLLWSCCALLFAVFRLLLNRESRLFAYLSEAAYSIYLFHHVFVITLALAMATYHWNVYLEFSIVAGASLALSLALHHFLVLRVRVLRLLFMGK